jgi:plastocyanin
MKALLTTLLLLTAGILQAGDIRGTVTVLKKGGDGELSSFDNTIVYLKGLSSAAPKTPAILDQVDKTFVPRVLPVVVGQEVQFWNRDKVMHNVFSTDVEPSFDLGRYPDGKYETQVFNTAGIFKIYCNIHQTMIADIVVLENTYFAATKEDGSYEIKDVPPGTYTLHAVHIFGGEAETSITIGKDPATQDFTLTSEKVVREIEDHKNKDGKSYRSRSYRR